MADGAVEKVRYIGIDTPEVRECGYERATAENAQLLARSEIRLELDADHRDRFGRLLAYVYAGNTMVNRELLRDGWADTLTIAPNTRYRTEFAGLASQARKRALGLHKLCR